MLGDNIRRIRKSKKISINNLNKMTGISLGYLSELENNIAKNPTMDILNKLADTLGVSVNDFFKDDNSNIVHDNDEQLKHSTSSEQPKTLEEVPEEFTDPEEARTYVKKHRIFASEGFNADKMADEKILEFANALLEQMRLVGYKYKK